MEKEYTFDELVRLKGEFDKKVNVTKDGVTFIAPSDFKQYCEYIILFGRTNRQASALHSNSFAEQYLKNKTGIDLFYTTYPEIGFKGTNISVQTYLTQYIKQKGLPISLYDL